jgi:hypothetical protein
MNKVHRDNKKKSTLVTSTIAILLMVTITSSPTMNSYAFDLGIISKDNNVGSIDTSSLFNCFGAAITCDNDNTVNNNIAINNGTNGNNQPLTCEECFTDYLTPVEISILEEDGLVDIQDYCQSLATLSPADLATALAGLEQFMDSNGIDPITAQFVVDCLEEVFG